MKNNKMNRFVSLLMATVMILMLLLSLAACGGVEETPDEPVTAEGKLINFINFKDPNSGPLQTTSDLTKELGRIYDSSYYKDYIVFYKSDKDRLNVITDTYSIYSVADAKAIFTVTNSYTDNLDGTDKFGNDIRPEIELLDCYFDTSTDIPVIAAEYIAYTPIAEDIIKDEDLEYSYTEEYYTEFYDVTGKLISTSYTQDRAYYVSGNARYTTISLGKTVGIFDNKTYELVESFNGDLSAMPREYFAINDKYNYGYTITGMSVYGYPNIAIEVLDKNNNLVCYYPYRDTIIESIPFFVLENGDVLIQYLEGYMTEEMEYTTFLLDVETGNVKELGDFKYRIDEIVLKDEFNENMEKSGILATDNVRNILVAYDTEVKKDVTVFMDNFGNVNFTFEGRICYDMEKDETFGDIRVLDDKNVLVKLAAGESEYAIIDYSGNVHTYVPHDATIFADRIVVGEDVYDFSMNNCGMYNTEWKNEYLDKYYDDSGIEDDYLYDNINFKYTAGNAEFYQFSYWTYYTENPAERSYGVVLYDALDNTTTEYKNYTVLGKVASYVDNANADLIVIGNVNKDIIKVINGNGNCVITLAVADLDVYTYSYEAIAIEGGAIFTFELDEGYLTIRIDESTMEGDYYGK